MNALLLLRNTAAIITLIAGLFAGAVRLAPQVAPETGEAAMIKLAALVGEDLGDPTPTLHAPMSTDTEMEARLAFYDGELCETEETVTGPRIVRLSRPRDNAGDPNLHLARFGTPAATRKVVRIAR